MYLFAKSYDTNRAEDYVVRKVSALVSQRLSCNPFARDIIECHLGITNGPVRRWRKEGVGKTEAERRFQPSLLKTHPMASRRAGQVTCDSVLINGRTCLTCWSQVALVH